jgi:hypothetical protein
MSAEKDLEHFLRVAAMQIRHRLKSVASQEAGSEPYSERINQMRMLEELIKEQIPHEDPRAATGAPR